MDSRLYKEASFRQAAGAEFRPGGLFLTEELALACELKAGERVLDLGCGVGATASHLRCHWGVAVWGLDSSPDFLAEAQERDPQVQWVLGRAEAIPFPDGHFDAVFSECFLSTVGDSAAVLREVRRVLRPGGRLALSDMYLRSPEAGGLADAQRCTCLAGRPGIDATLELLRSTGFAVQYWKDRSEALKTLMASLILTYGSAAEFWKASAGQVPLPAVSEQIRASRPGYFVLVASAPAAAANEGSGLAGSRGG